MVGDDHRRERSVQRPTRLSAEILSTQSQRSVQIRIECEYDRALFDGHVRRYLLMLMLTPGPASRGVGGGSAHLSMRMTPMAV